MIDVSSRTGDVNTKRRCFMALDCFRMSRRDATERQVRQKEVGIRKTGRAGGQDGQLETDKKEWENKKRIKLEE